MEFDREYRRLMEAYEKDVSKFHNFFEELAQYQSNHYGTYDSSRLRDEYLKLPEDFKRMMRLPKSRYKNCYRGDDGKSEKPVLSFVYHEDPETAKSNASFYGRQIISLRVDIKSLLDTMYFSFDQIARYFGQKISWKIMDEYGLGDGENEVLIFDAVFRKRARFDEEYRKLMLEFSEGAIRNIVKKFQNDATEREIRREIDDFEKYKKSLQKKDPFQYKTWIEFTEAIHAAKGKAEFKKGTPTQDVVANQDDIIADDENVTIYRGDSQDKCVLYGKGYTFCISRKAGGNMFSNYRLGKDSTFYFIYFKKKPKSVTDHIMVLDHTKNGWEWTFADNATEEVGGGWEEIVGKYPELGRYKDLFVNKTLDDDERLFMDKMQTFTLTPLLKNFNNFSYGEKVTLLKNTIEIRDDIWKTLDSTLRNEFLSIGPNLSEYQADDLKPNEIERYKKMRAISFDELVDATMLNISKHENIETLISNPEKYSRYIYSYARNFCDKYENVPDVIVNAMSKTPGFAHDFAKFADYKKIPDAIRRVLMNNVPYAEEVSDAYSWGTMPRYLREIILSDPRSSYNRARDIIESVQYMNYEMDVDEALIQSISRDSFYAYEYAYRLLEWKYVPKIILQAIDKNDIPDNVTIQESLHFDKQYQKLMSSFFK